MVERAGSKHSAQTQRRTFLLLIGMFISAQVVILALAFGTLWLINLTRAYTTAEGFYAKGQKQAVYALQRYAYSADPADFDSYRRKLQVPLGDLRAREALERQPPDPETAREGFLQGRNHPDDIAGMIQLFLWFKDTPLFNPAVEIWRHGDRVIERIADRAEILHQAIETGMLDDARRRRLLVEIHELDQEVTLLQDEFSQTLGAIARTIRNAAFVILGTASILLWTACLGFGWQLHQRSVAAEIALAQREQRLRALMDSTADGIISIGPDSRIDAANRAAARMFGCDEADLHHRPIEELVAPEDHTTFTTAVHTALNGDPRNGARGELTLSGRRADDTVFPMETAFTRQEGTDEPRLIVTLRDITERRATEARLFQAQKMETVGQLTGGIAHDFNNLLTVVIGSLESLGEDRRESRESAENTRQLIQGALSAAERGARLTSQLLAFSRRQPLAPKPVDVDALVAGMRDLFGRTLPETVDLGCKLNSHGWHAMVDPVQLESALLNLVINARQAMPEGGSLTIETGRLPHTVAPDARSDLNPDDYVMIRVSDTGCGIAPEHWDKVFEPFFTTKDVGQGSGLGLSMVHGFVKQSGGGIRLDSRLGEGTTIELFLPGVPAGLESDVAQTPILPRHPGARILVVEDDPAVRTATIKLLEALGHSVVEAEDGAAALDLLARDRALDLVLSDVVLPCGMDGYALASQVRMRHPGIRVLLMSGYPRDALAGADRSELLLLKKPFTRERLQQAIEETMAQPA